MRWSKILQTQDSENSKFLAEAAQRIADHVCRRALHFPTEGEPCTEDGSMACAASTLLYAYRYLCPNPEYLAVAKKILDKHRVLEMEGTDCRMRGSSLRFWETQYETRDWGPSINAGHGWTIWTSEAKAQLAIIEGNVDLLKDSYQGFVTNMCKVNSSGGMYCCYTPDMIPDLPHAYCPEGVADPGLAENDLRPTTTHLAMRFPEGAFSASGNYYLIRAAEIWDHVSGLNLKTRISINGVLENGVFYSSAVKFSCVLIGGTGKARIFVKGVKALRIIGDREYSVCGANTEYDKDGRKLYIPTEPIITFLSC